MSDDNIPLILDSENEVVTSVGETAVKYQQFIPRTFLEDIRKDREASITTPAGETFYRVARIPAAVLDKWHRENFDYHRASAREILAKLRKDQLDEYIATKKRI